MKLSFPLLFAGTALLTLPVAAHAMDAPASEAAKDSTNNVFEPAYFERFAPRTALDMVGRIPGFQIQSGDSKRGLGQGGANVLINGKRLSGKTGPSDQLSRITAGSVVRISVVDGAALDIPGLSGQVVNIETKNTGVTGTWEWNPEWRNKLEPTLARGSLSVSGETGNISYSAKISSDPRRNGHWGPESQFTPAGTLFETRDENGRYNADLYGLSGDITWTPKDDHVANINADYNSYNSNNRELSKSTAITPQGQTLETHFSNAEDEWNASVSADYEFPFGPKAMNGKLKLIGYHRAEHSPTISRFDVYDPVAGLVDSSRFFQVADEGESILRSEYSWSKSDGYDWSLGLEGAFNVLDIENQFVDILTPANNGDDASRVEEKRAEATLTHTRPMTPKWTLQTSLGAEYSELTQTGGLARDFFRPKGFLLASYKHDHTLTINTKLEREVGQLSFFDFISSVDLQDNLDRTGNVNLVPSQTWLAEVEFDKNFGDGNTFKARFYAQKIDDLVDRIPITVSGVDGDAVGNIDSANRYGVDFDATLKGKQWGLKGTELNLEFDLRNSSVDDPVEGFARRLNGDKKYYWSAEFRHDIPNTDWAWGLYMDQYREAKSYRLSTINDFRFDGPWAQVYIEHKDIVGLKIRGTLKNLFDASDDFKRTVYTDRRDLGVISRIEDRTRPFGMFFQLNVSGTF